MTVACRLFKHPSWHLAGEMHYPYEWAPYIVEISIMRIGNLVVLAVPGEFTTMSGRRLIRAVRDKVWFSTST